MSTAAPLRGATPAPTVAHPLGVPISLAGAASLIAERYYEEYPDRWLVDGRLGFDWCRYANQWVLAWAAQDLTGGADLCEQAVWLARFLSARGRPAADVVRDLQIASRVALESFGDVGPAMAEQLMLAAHTVATLGID